MIRHIARAQQTLVAGVVLFGLLTNPVTAQNSPTSGVELMGEPSGGTNPEGSFISTNVSINHPWEVKPNWAEAKGELIEWTQSLTMEIRGDFNCDKTLKKVGEIYKDLEEFTCMSEGSKTIFEIVKPTAEEVQANPGLAGRQWAKISDGEVPTFAAWAGGVGEGSYPTSPVEFYVELIYDGRSTVRAITLGSHPIVGVREFNVQIRRQSETVDNEEGVLELNLSTYAIEFRSGIRAEIGFLTKGIQSTVKLFNRYLTNIAEKYTDHQKSGSYALAPKVPRSPTAQQVDLLIEKVREKEGGISFYKTHGKSECDDPSKIGGLLATMRKVKAAVGDRTDLLEGMPAGYLDK